MQELLGQWSRGEVEVRRDRALARRLSAQRTASAVYGADVSDTGGEHRNERDATREVASAPGVIDLLERREAKAAGRGQVLGGGPQSRPA